MEAMTFFPSDTMAKISCRSIEEDRGHGGGWQRFLFCKSKFKTRQWAQAGYLGDSKYVQYMKDLCFTSVFSDTVHF